jgi:integrase
VCQLNVRDFDPETKTLSILGKGRGTQSEVIDLGGGTVAAISEWLECGNVRKVQKLSRHRKLDTLMIYDDNRHRDQGEITDLLDGMF